MEKSRIELKVGLFAFVALILLTILLIAFSKSTSIFRGTHNLNMHASNVGGLKERAAVLLAGVQVGSVYAITLAPDGKSVYINLRVYNDYKIYKDARFVIEQAGFLGDQYVSVIPTLNEGGVLTNDEEVICEEPFNLQEVARSASGFIKRIDETAQKLDASVGDLRRVVLNEQTLTNFSAALINFRKFSEDAVGTVTNINFVINSNSAQVAVAVSNLVFFSEELTTLAGSAQNMLNTNGTQLTAATKNIETSTETINSLLADVQSGKGLAGTVLQNEQLSTNVQAIANNIAVATSNLNRLGLWSFLWHHEPLHTNGVVTPPKE
jgi:phospholipid/cholesterol/gamma-HCH transport system substrate-binding protein